MNSDIVGTVTCSYDITREFINDLMTTAFDAGVGGCWYWVTDYENYLDGKTGKETGVEYFHDVVAEGGTLSIQILDGEDDEWYDINTSKLLLGIQQYCKERNKTPEALMEDHDADDADCIVQMAIFAKVVYG